MTKTTKAYIAGKVTGLPAGIAARNFRKLEQSLKKEGLITRNPVARLDRYNAKRINDGLPPLCDNTHRKEIMGLCILMLSQCDEIHMLPNWNESEGAIMEHNFAMKTNMKIVYHLLKEQKNESHYD